MDQQLLDEINSGFGNLRKRLEELEKVHCRYQGPRGERGAPAKVSVGRVEVGDTASVKVRPLDGNIYELDFVLPVGSHGKDGRDGRDGYSDIPGPAGPRGHDGVDGRVVIGQVVGGSSAVAAIHVADDTQIIDLVLPRGPEGAPGPRGETGAQGPQGISGRDGSDGKDSTVAGPRGDQGLQGVQGPAGPKGDSPTTDELLKLIRSVIDENPERFRGPSGVSGRDGKDGVGIRGPIGKPGDISAAVAQAEKEARSIVEEALAEIHARLERLEAK